MKNTAHIDANRSNVGVATLTKSVGRPNRLRMFAHICHNCKSYIPEGLDEPEDKPFCVFDGCEVNEYQTCELWTRDVGVKEKP